MRLFRSFASSCLYIPMVLKTRYSRRKNVRILMYHSISHFQNYNQLVVPPQNFDGQMKYLFDKGYSVISLEELIYHIRNRKEIPYKSIVITFDDGYKDNYTYAFPILKKYNFTATIFLTTNYIGKDKRLGWAKMSALVESGGLSWEQISEMSNYGISFDNHTCSHPILTEIDDERARHEIIRSKSTIEEKLGTEVKFFAYPGGYFSQKHKDMVAEAGFLGACSIVPGSNDAKTDIFALRRTEISPKDTIFDFRKKLVGAYDCLHHVIQSWQKRTCEKEIQSDKDV